ncbi:hypothetical protein A9Q84_12425 [Halobacteriovorax marinus]|uniref:Thioredoxin domain-containing protein n=1 Tax=Halobacteriovorax marinus TaxID=97084 RepID=A0A1Y5F894_9BACT|nr:hypothetical protein A9Q84_12425 [Halobacteriovorax marinus]
MEKLTDDNFESVINAQNGPFFIKFGSTSCGPCNTMAPVLEKLSFENPSFPMFEVDTNLSPDIAAHFEIKSVPTMHFCEDREVFFTSVGITPFRDLQFVINNIDDVYMREHGHFKVEQKKSYFAPILISSIVFFLLLMFLL